MEPNDVFKNTPLFRIDQVLTVADIDAIKHGYLYQYEATPWYHPIEKFKYLVAVGTMNSLFHWLRDGKPITKKETDDEI
jgi:hypothetical protein